MGKLFDPCGYGVPLMSFDGLRPHHAASSAKKLRVKGDEGYRTFRRARGAQSLDGLPALQE